MVGVLKFHIQQYGTLDGVLSDMVLQVFRCLSYMHDVCTIKHEIYNALQNEKFFIILPQWNNGTNFLAQETTRFLINRSLFDLVDFILQIKSMKENYLPELNEMYQKSASKLQRHTSLPQQPKSYKLEKLKKFMKMLECAIAFLQVSKSNISPNYRLKLDSCEKQIIKIININRPKKTVPPLQYGQFPPPHMQSH